MDAVPINPDGDSHMPRKHKRHAKDGEENSRVPYDLGLGSGITRVLVSVGVVGFICILFWSFSVNFWQFFIDENKVRREETKATLMELRIERERNDIRYEELGKRLEKVMRANDECIELVRRDQRLLTESLRVMTDMVSELKRIKGP